MIFNPFYVESIEMPARVNRLYLIVQPYRITPRAVPNVFVIRSVVPESRVGRNACKTSMARLTKNPTAIVTSAGCSILRTKEEYEQKKNPSGTKPATLIPTFFQ
jgi:hypothetical protein